MRCSLLMLYILALVGCSGAAAGAGVPRMPPTPTAHGLSMTATHAPSGVSTQTARGIVVTEEPRVAQTIPFDELPRYGTAGDSWRPIIVQPQTSRADLLALMSRLHTQSPQDRFEFFNDRTQLQHYELSMMHTNSDGYPYPEVWATHHLLARIKLVVPDTGGKPHWQAVLEDGSAVVDLDRTQTR